MVDILGKRYAEAAAALGSVGVGSLCAVDYHSGESFERQIQGFGSDGIGDEQFEKWLSSATAQARADRCRRDELKTVLKKFHHEPNLIVPAPRDLQRRAYERLSFHEIASSFGADSSGETEFRQWLHRVSEFENQKLAAVENGKPANTVLAGADYRTAQNEYVSRFV